ncbi:MAG: metallophosphoesterase [Rhodobacteraceae bacterium]|nr:metallophosphoesterase [Paracoccaceae bacterium]
MRRILHLSDLHYGRDLPELEAPLLETIHQLAPDLVAISGDFTQRARVWQFDRARAFLDRLGPDMLAVPGNHDTPLDNLWIRLVRPWARYRAAIAAELEPVHRDDEMVVAGVNTVNRFAWQRGRFSGHTADRICRAFADAGDRLKVAVLHHPLEHGPDETKRLMRGAGPALARLRACGTDIVLSGHLHSTVIAPFSAAPGILFVQAGTGLSGRLRGESNMFNLVDADPDRITITPYEAKGVRFVPAEPVRFRRDGTEWRRTRSAPARAASLRRDLATAPS